MTSFWNRLKFGLAAFKEAFLTSPVIDAEEWNSQDARNNRYGLLWAQYDSTSYRNIHQWAQKYRKDYALYKYIRPIYNPAYRLGEFWKTHLYGGLLDPDAGETGAVPIATEIEALRPAIAELWKWSRWKVNKDLLTVKGTILGDTIIRIVDNVQRNRVYLELLYPGRFDWIVKDPFGNVKSYKIKEYRPDPIKMGVQVLYEELVTRDGDLVVWQTFRNREPFAWPENVDRSGQPVARWTEPYGFVPLVAIQHNEAGLKWGWSELHPSRAKVQEVDGLASQMSDQIRKTIDPVWLMKGIQKPKSGSVTMTKRATSPADTSNTETSTLNRPEPGREEINALWGVHVDGGAEAMVPKLDLEQTLAYLSSMLAELERDMPELSPDIHTSSGDASGRALRVARQPVVSKVIQRRVNYDAGLVAAQQMAISIGGFRGYEGYQGFNLESFGRGQLEHHIADRPVFEEDPLDSIEVQSAFWEAAGKAVKSGASLEGYLREAGWDEARIAATLAQREATDGEPGAQDQTTGDN
jgi:hypothetical protein